MKLDTHPNAKKTYKWDMVRGTVQGLTEASIQTFGLVVAIRYFHAQEWVKALIPAALSLGLLLNSWIFQHASRIGKKPTHYTSYCYLLASITFLLMGTIHSLFVFVAGIVFCQLLAAQILPMMTHVYALNYSPKQRGQKLSTSILLGTLIGAIFSYFAGKALDLDLNKWTYIYLIAAIAAATSALAVWRMPSEPLEKNHTKGVLKNLKIVTKDKVFGAIIFAWFFLGFGNLMTLPLRIEYIANPKYGIDASNAQIGIIMGTLPLVARLVSTKVWGYVFDRLDLMTVRNAINFCFLASIIAFFATKNLYVMAAGMVCLGFAMGGGGVIWNLWVTKVAPPDEVTSYMSVHTFSTGVRGTLAPFLGFFLIAKFDPQFAGMIGAILVIASMIMFQMIKPYLLRRIQ